MFPSAVRQSPPVLAIALLALFSVSACAAAEPPALTDGLTPVREIADSGRETTVWHADDSDSRRLGWHRARLGAAFRNANALGSDTLIVSTGGRIVGLLGDPGRKYRVHSVRKALLSALVGRHAGDGPGQIPLQARLVDLGIDDSPGPLTPLQRTATVEHLLASRSGINHKAASEGGLFAEKTQRLGLGENQPGRIWAYNNWDYNALTTIFEQRTGLSVAEAFDRAFAAPLGLQDFERSDVSYRRQPALSQHRAAHFRLSGRDLLRLGQLYLREGRIEDREILSPAWIARITQRASRTGKTALRWAHGDLWWLPAPDFGLPPGSYLASGLGRQTLLVVPAWDTVIVHQADTGEVLKRLSPVMQREGGDVIGALIAMIRQCRTPAHRASPFCAEHRFIGGREFDDLIRAIAAART